MPDVGETFTSSEEIGQGFGSIPTGTQVTVAEVVSAGEKGAGDGSEDSVIVEFTDDDGADRRVSIPSSQFDQRFGGIE